MNSNTCNHHNGETGATVLRPVFSKISLPLASCLLPMGVPGLEELIACLAKERETAPALQCAE